MKQCNAADMPWAKHLVLQKKERKKEKENIFVYYKPEQITLYHDFFFFFSVKMRILRLNYFFC